MCSCMVPKCSLERNWSWYHGESLCPLNKMVFLKIWHDEAQNQSGYEKDVEYVMYSFGGNCCQSQKMKCKNLVLSLCKNIKFKTRATTQKMSRTLCTLPEESFCNSLCPMSSTFFCQHSELKLKIMLWNAWVVPTDQTGMTSWLYRALTTAGGEVCSSFTRLSKRETCLSSRGPAKWSPCCC